MNTCSTSYANFFWHSADCELNKKIKIGAAKLRERELLEHLVLQLQECLSMLNGQAFLKLGNSEKDLLTKNVWAGLLWCEEGQGSFLSRNQISVFLLFCSRLSGEKKSLDPKAPADMNGYQIRVWARSFTFKPYNSQQTANLSWIDKLTWDKEKVWRRQFNGQKFFFEHLGWDTTSELRHKIVVL